MNHNQALVRATTPATSLKVKTHVKAGRVVVNHNETLVWATPRKRSRA